jgi:hypothetical protein
MNCPNCGSELRPDARSCQQCGFELARSSETPQSAHTPAASAVDRPTPAPLPQVASIPTRHGHRGLRLIALGALGVSIALILAGNYVYQTNGFLIGESTAASVSLKGSDLPPGMTRCNVSGRPRGGYTPPYGATDVWTVVHADRCDLPPARRYAFSWVLEYPSETAAVAGFQAFVGSPDCTIAHVCVDGLGPNSNVHCGIPQGPSQSGTGSCLGTWQRNVFVLTVEIMGIDEAKKAVLNMDARAQQLAAPATALSLATTQPTVPQATATVPQTTPTSTPRG